MGRDGLDNSDWFITEYDDSGAGQNSRIARDLSSGTYYVRLRHYSSSSTGNTCFRQRLGKSLGFPP